MAKMIDQKPTFHGEAKVWDALNSFLPNNIIVYNNREINGREFDYCLLIENIGLLIVEVKGWLTDKITHYPQRNIQWHLSLTYGFTFLFQFRNFTF